MCVLSEQEVPAAQFDWNSAGLVNPLESSTLFHFAEKQISLNYFCVCFGFTSNNHLVMDLILLAKMKKKKVLLFNVQLTNPWLTHASTIEIGK